MGGGRALGVGFESSTGSGPALFSLVCLPQSLPHTSIPQTELPYPQYLSRRTETV